jgi:hypothetical protein
MTNDRTTAYFDDVVSRAIDAPVVPKEPWPEAVANRCHENAERFIQQVSGYEVVRGWLVGGGHFLMPHTVVRHTTSRRLVDITPDPSDSAFPFVEHSGSEADFAILRQGRDGVGCTRRTSHFPSDCRRRPQRPFICMASREKAADFAIGFPSNYKGSQRNTVRFAESNARRFAFPFAFSRQGQQNRASIGSGFGPNPPPVGLMTCTDSTQAI